VRVVVDRSAIEDFIREVTDVSSESPPANIPEPVAPTSLPIEAQPKAIIDMSGIAPPIRDEEYVPANNYDLSYATSALSMHVPPEKVEKFYRIVRKLVLDVITQNREEQKSPELESMDERILKEDVKLILKVLSEASEEEIEAMASKLGLKKDLDKEEEEEDDAPVPAASDVVDWEDIRRDAEELGLVGDLPGQFKTAPKTVSALTNVTGWMRKRLGTRKFDPDTQMKLEEISNMSNIVFNSLVNMFNKPYDPAGDFSDLHRKNVAYRVVFSFFVENTLQDLFGIKSTNLAVAMEKISKDFEEAGMDQKKATRAALDEVYTGLRQLNVSMKEAYDTFNDNFKLMFVDESSPSYIGIGMDEVENLDDTERKELATKIGAPSDSVESIQDVLFDKVFSGPGMKVALEYMSVLESSYDKAETALKKSSGQ